MIDRLKLFEWTATGLSIMGALFNAFQQIEGFYIWCTGNIIWIVLGIKRKMWGLMVTFIIFTIINILGIIYWSK